MEICEPPTNLILSTVVFEQPLVQDLFVTLLKASFFSIIWLQFKNDKTSGWNIWHFSKKMILLALGFMIAMLFFTEKIVVQIDPKLKFILKSNRK
jgi:predicted small integral membrane protein